MDAFMLRRLRASSTRPLGMGKQVGGHTRIWHGELIREREFRVCPMLHLSPGEAGFKWVATSNYVCRIQTLAWVVEVRQWIHRITFHCMESL